MREARVGCAVGADHRAGWEATAGPAIAGHMGTATTWIAVAGGGALGSLARYWLAAVMTALTGPRFPWGTLLINVAGSLIIGLVAAVTLPPPRVAMHPDLRVFLMVGICGGFTTFSAFSLQTLELLQAGEFWPAAGYVAGSVALCLAGGWLGWFAGGA
jgi:CrcB protein